MPTYAFRCPECATSFDERRGFAQSDDPAICPGCGGDRARKQFGTPMVFRKGVAARALLEAPGSQPMPQVRAAAASSHGGDCPCCSGRRPAAAAAPVEST